MSVSLGGDDDFPAPQLREGSPAIPSGIRQPTRGDTVFVDTSAIIGSDDSRLPLLLLSFGRQLDVCWSPYVAAEVARVATREQAFATVSRGAETRTQLSTELEVRRHEIDRVIADHERRWRSPEPDALRYVIAAHGSFPISDASDHPVLAAALAVDAPFLVTANSRDFPHGKSYAGVTFWYPDTFLTAYFLSHPDAYIFVRQEYEAFSGQMGAQLRP